MKKISLIIAALALVLGISQCKKNENSGTNDGNQHIVLKASFGVNCAKVDQNGNGLKWAIDDVLTVLQDGKTSGTLKCTNAETGTFEGDVELTKADLAFTFGEQQFTNQSGNLNDAIYLESGTMPVNNTGEYEARMNMPYALMVLNVSAFADDIMGDETAMEIRFGREEVASLADFSTTSGIVYVAIPASSAAGDYTINSNGKSAVMKWPALEANTFYTQSGSATGEAIMVEPQFEYVDLGLPSGLKWATCNLGASEPLEYGDFFSWGEVVGHQPDSSLPAAFLVPDAFKADFESFDHSDARYTASWTASNGFGWLNNPFHSGADTVTGWNKYIPSDKISFWSGVGTPDNKTVLDPEDDAASVIMGGSWRLPTRADFDELLSNTTKEWVCFNNGTRVYGYVFTSTIAGFEDKSIFLPAAGYAVELKWIGQTEFGNYWSSSLTTDNPSKVNECYFFNGPNLQDANIDNALRSYGQSIRPVSE